MIRRVLLAFVLIYAASPATPDIPDTPAGHTFSVWLQAFNSGDRAQMDAYYRKYDPVKSVDDIMPFRMATGGFEVLQILESQALRLGVLVKEKNSDTRAIIKFEVKVGDPAMVITASLRALPPGTSVADLSFKIDAAERARVIDGAVRSLNEFYVFPDVAKKMEEAVRNSQRRGDYDSVTDGDTFAGKLTEDFRSVSHDKHLRVNFSPAPIPENAGSGKPSPEDLERFRKDMLEENCGFKKVEILPGNVGYLKFNMFGDPDICGPTAVSAMNFLANIDAIIFDLRENGGGDPKMVAFVCSYLFAEPTHLNDLWNRKDDSTHQFWTLPFVPGKLLDHQPAFVLTSKQTFSGGEEFTYNLKNLKRATIVGETTGGGAHPVSGHRLDDHFMIGVPSGRAINPVTKTNWEGTGVEPDVKVAAADALTTAEKLAAEKIAAAKTASK